MMSKDKIFERVQIKYKLFVFSNNIHGHYQAGGREERRKRYIVLVEDVEFLKLVVVLF